MIWRGGRFMNSKNKPKPTFYIIIDEIVQNSKVFNIRETCLVHLLSTSPIEMGLFNCTPPHLSKIEDSHLLGFLFYFRTPNLCLLSTYGGAWFRTGEVYNLDFFLWNPDTGSCPRGPRFRTLSWRAPGAQASGPSPKGLQGSQEPQSSVVHH